MERYIINNINVYKINPTKEMKIIKRLIALNYCVIYDSNILDDDKNILMIPNELTLKESYIAIKSINKYSYVTKNLVEIGHVKIKK